MVSLAPYKRTSHLPPSSLLGTGHFRSDFVRSPCLKGMQESHPFPDKGDNKGSSGEGHKW